jgi:hypothetical protein
VAAGCYGLDTNDDIAIGLVVDFSKWLVVVGITICFYKGVSRRYSSWFSYGIEGWKRKSRVR